MLRRQDQSDPRQTDKTLSAPDEARLVAAVAAGDLKSFEALYRIYHPRLTRFLMNMLHAVTWRRRRWTTP